MTNLARDDDLVAEWEFVKAQWCRIITEQKFDCFFTITFKKPATSGRMAIDRTRRCLSEFYNQVGGSVAAFVVAEPHQQGTFHCHGLLRLGPSDDAFKGLFCHSLWKSTFDRYGRCSFETIKDPQRVELYIVKYLLKEVVEYEFIGRGLIKVGTKNGPPIM